MGETNVSPASNKHYDHTGLFFNPWSCSAYCEEHRAFFFV